MKLHWSPRSPFVRKVMIVAHERGVADRITCVRTVAATTKPHAELMKDNPLSKIPALVLDGGAVIFVCGDGSRMEPDVKRALMTLHRERSGADEAAARRWIDDLGAKSRYVLDVWAGS